MQNYLKVGKIFIVAWITYIYVWQRFERYFSHHRAKWIDLFSLILSILKYIINIINHIINNIYTFLENIISNCLISFFIVHYIIYKLLYILKICWQKITLQIQKRNVTQLSTTTTITATTTTTTTTPLPSVHSITQSNPGLSCKSIKEQFGSSASSGLYWIDLSPAVQVYCDMVTAGG